MSPRAPGKALQLGKGVARFTHLEQRCGRQDALRVLLSQTCLPSFHVTKWKNSHFERLVNWGVTLGGLEVPAP
jgi:hypothetical protein